MRTVLRGLAVWVCIIFVEVLHGIARTWFLAPVIGDFHARQVAVFTGSILVVLVATMFIGWLRPANAREAAWVGIVWLVLTLTFEIVFGRFVAQASWTRIATASVGHGFSTAADGAECSEIEATIGLALVDGIDDAGPRCAETMGDVLSG